MPKLPIRLVFETTEFSPVEISGYIESNEATIFSKDPEHQISIICPEPNFISVDPTVITGTANDPPIVIDYEGTIDVGINLDVAVTAIPFPLEFQIALDGDPQFQVALTQEVEALTSFVVNSVTGQKYIIVIPTGGGNEIILQNALHGMSPESVWPILQPGPHEFAVFSTPGDHDWTLTYYTVLGSL